jgi:hypothetical protein
MIIWQCRRTSSVSYYFSSARPRSSSTQSGFDKEKLMKNSPPMMPRLPTWTPMSTPLIGAVLLICAAPVTAQNQPPDATKLKADAQKVVSIIGRDRLKTQTYCQILELNDQIDQDENPEKTDELAQKIDNLEGKLGPEFMKLVHDVSNMDPDSPDAQEIRATIESLDGLCSD